MASALSGSDSAISAASTAGSLYLTLSVCQRTVCAKLWWWLVLQQPCKSPGVVRGRIKSFSAKLSSVRPLHPVPTLKWPATARHLRINVARPVTVVTTALRLQTANFERARLQLLGLEQSLHAKLWRVLQSGQVPIRPCAAMVPTRSMAASAISSATGDTDQSRISHHTSAGAVTRWMGCRAISHKWRGQTRR